MNMKWKIMMMGNFCLKVRGKEMNLESSMGEANRVYFCIFDSSSRQDSHKGTVN